MVCVEFAEVVGRCRRRHPLKNTRRGLNERNLDARAGGDCGGFESDVAASHDQKPPAFHEFRCHCINVSQAAHDVHTV